MTMISRRSFGFFGGAKKAVEKATGGASQPYDVLIVGGGPAGLALASSLGSSSHLKSLKIGLIEANSLDSVRNWSSDAYSNRCSSISAANFEYLQRKHCTAHTAAISHSRRHGRSQKPGHLTYLPHHQHAGLGRQDRRQDHIREAAGR